MMNAVFIRTIIQIFAGRFARMQPYNYASCQNETSTATSGFG